MRSRRSVRPVVVSASCSVHHRAGPAPRRLFLNSLLRPRLKLFIKGHVSAPGRVGRIEGSTSEIDPYFSSNSMHADVMRVKQGRIYIGGTTRNTYLPWKRVRDTAFLERRKCRPALVARAHTSLGRGGGPLEARGGMTPVAESSAEPDHTDQSERRLVRPGQSEGRLGRHASQ